MGLSFIGIGLVSLKTSEDSHLYDGHYHCSSVKDQTILWMGIAIVCSISFALMASFWPESRIDVDELNREPPRRVFSFCRKDKQVMPLLENMEPLLPDEDMEEEGGGRNMREDAVSTDGSGIDECNTSVRNEEERHTAHETTSRLRGTSRLLKLAGSESLYLWVGIVVLLVRLPFSLAIPHFVSTTIGSLINENYDAAKREVLLLFLLGCVDSVLDFWCIFLFGKAKERIVRAVRVDTFSSILQQDQAFFDESNTGDLVSRLTSDCGEMAGDLTWFFRFSVEAVVRITG